MPLTPTLMTTRSTSSVDVIYQSAQYKTPNNLAIQKIANLGDRRAAETPRKISRIQKGTGSPPSPLQHDKRVPGYARSTISSRNKQTQPQTSSKPIHTKPGTSRAVTNQLHKRSSPHLAAPATTPNTTTMAVGRSMGSQRHLPILLDVPSYARSTVSSRKKSATEKSSTMPMGPPGQSVTPLKWPVGTGPAITSRLEHNYLQSTKAHRSSEVVELSTARESISKQFLRQKQGKDQTRQTLPKSTIHDKPTALLRYFDKLGKGR